MERTIPTLFDVTSAFPSLTTSATVPDGLPLPHFQLQMEMRAWPERKRNHDLRHFLTFVNFVGHLDTVSMKEGVTGYSSGGMSKRTTFHAAATNHSPLGYIDVRKAHYVIACGAVSTEEAVGDEIAMRMHNNLFWTRRQLPIAVRHIAEAQTENTFEQWIL